jgi:hypothetical protein
MKPAFHACKIGRCLKGRSYYTHAILHQKSDHAGDAGFENLTDADFFGVLNRLEYRHPEYASGMDKRELDALSGRIPLEEK